MVPSAERDGEPSDMKPSADVVTLYLVAASAKGTLYSPTLGAGPANWHFAHHDRRSTDA